LLTQTDYIVIIAVLALIAVGLISLVVVAVISARRDMRNPPLKEYMPAKIKCSKCRRKIPIEEAKSGYFEIDVDGDPPEPRKFYCRRCGEKEKYGIFVRAEAFLK